jgi:hypothetical protein
MSLKIVRIFSLTIASVITGCSNTPSISVDKNELAAGQNYNGSVFKDLKALVWQNPYEKLPYYKVDKLRIHSKEFTDNSARTLDNHQDFINSYRPKIVHPNGVCLSGVWHVNLENADNTYTGYFANGSTGLILARASTAGTEVDIEKSRTATLTGKKYISYGFTGKIFPTVSSEDQKHYRPANFITQTDLGGQETADFSDVELMNAPNVTAMNRGIVGGGVEIFAKTGITFASVDQSTTIRQLYEIAELNKPLTARTNAPQYLKLVASAGDRKKIGLGDFRQTLPDYIKRNNQISFDIYVANEGFTKTLTPLIQNTVIKDEWKKIGTAIFSDAVASQACDFNLHFHHPAWRKDRNDPNTTVRQKTPNQ